MLAGLLGVLAGADFLLTDFLDELEDRLGFDPDFLDRELEELPVLFDVEPDDFLICLLDVLFLLLLLRLEDFELRFIAFCRDWLLFFPVVCRSWDFSIFLSPLFFLSVWDLALFALLALAAFLDSSYDLDLLAPYTCFLVTSLALAGLYLSRNFERLPLLDIFDSLDALTDL